MNTTNIFHSQPTNSLWLLPLGGCGEFGNNAMLYRYQGSGIIVDMGIMFTDERKLGINGQYPDLDPIFKETNGIQAYVITHGHEDHIGALPFSYEKWPAPIYATEWTIELIKNRFSRFNKDAPPIQLVKPGERIVINKFQIEYIYVNHSIPDACALYIQAGDHKVFQTGDFKFDAESMDGQCINEERLKAIGNKGVNLLLADSTNATTSGFSNSEKSVQIALEREFSYDKGRIFIATFASNLWRLIAIIEACKKIGKKLYIAGSGYEKTLAIAKKLNRYNPPSGILIDEAQLTSLPTNKIVVLVSGSQGEWRSTLPSIAYGEHKLFKVKENDLLILSSRMIPGNERAILSVINAFRKNGAKTLTSKEAQDIHVSGHAHKEELKKLLDLLKPNYYLPVHGGYVQLGANRELATTASIPTSSIEQPFDNGQIIQLDALSCRFLHQVDIKKIYVDADSNLPIDYETMRSRLRIGELGMGLWFGVLSNTRDWLLQPEIDTIGLSFPENFDLNAWKQRLITATKLKIRNLDPSTSNFQEECKEICRLELRRSLTKILNKKPVALVKLLFQS
ncbi:MAG: ribonuclease J [Bdellovibrionota bacterium]